VLAKVIRGGGARRARSQFKPRSRVGWGCGMAEILFLFRADEKA